MNFYNKKLFDFIYCSVLEDGGDGDATIIFKQQDHKVVASEFQEWLKDNSCFSWTRKDREEGIVLHHDQESFFLTNERWDKNPPERFNPERMLVVY